jgi:hypothetical protein
MAVVYLSATETDPQLEKKPAVRLGYSKRKSYHNMINVCCLGLQAINRHQPEACRTPLAPDS